MKQKAPHSKAQISEWSASILHKNLDTLKHILPKSNNAFIVMGVIPYYVFNKASKQAICVSVVVALL